MKNGLSNIFEQVEIGNLILRMPTFEDAGAVFMIHGDPATNLYNPAGPMRSHKEANENIANWRQDWLVNGYGYWSVVNRNQSEVIGFGGIALRKLGDREVLNLYYRFSPKSWGHGYATELARVAVQMARLHLPELPVVARIRPQNTASIRVAQKVGLVNDPKLNTKDHKIFTIGWTEQTCCDRTVSVHR